MHKNMCKNGKNPSSQKNAITSESIKIALSTFDTTILRPVTLNLFEK